jgi:hypothetical protein
MLNHSSNDHPPSGNGKHTKSGPCSLTDRLLDIPNRVRRMMSLLDHLASGMYPSYCRRSYVLALTPFSGQPTMSNTLSPHPDLVPSSTGGGIASSLLGRASFTRNNGAAGERILITQ